MNRRQGIIKTGLWSIMILVMFLLCCFTVLAPPIPRTIEGRILNTDASAGMENSIPVTINSTVVDEVFLTYTNAPDLPDLRGSYSANINGSNGDLVIVTSWNGTHWGRNQTTISGKTTAIDVALNSTRQSEANVTLSYPSNHSRFHADDQMNVTVSVFWRGLSGSGCTINLTFSNASILTPRNGSPLSIPISTVSYGRIDDIVYNLTANVTGVTNVTVQGYCDSDGIYFDHEHTKTHVNITVYDNTPPYVVATSPPNESTRGKDTSIEFVYSVIDNGTVNNCTFLVNNDVNSTNTTIPEGETLRFNTSFAIGNYTWEILCTDNSSTPNTGSSGVFNLTIAEGVNAPSITDITIENPIYLTPGGTTRVTCNITVDDPQGSSDITTANATLYFKNAPSEDIDNNTRYINSSCVNTSSGISTKKFMCGFDVFYYANSSEWTCSATVFDQAISSETESIDTNISELFALDVTPSLVDYQTVAPGSTSAEEYVTIQNLGNIPLNLSIRGYGATLFDNLSMNCTLGNVSIEQERYASTSGEAFAAMEPLNSTYETVYNFTVPVRTNDTAPQHDERNLYWKLRLPEAIGGRCNGTINFLAVQVQ